MSVPQLKDWPTPIAPALREIVDALKKRSKAIKGKTGTGKFNISLVSDDVKGERFERLNLAITLFTNADQYTDIRLAFWDDILLRIDIRRPATGRQGWDYNYGRLGDFTDVSSRTIAEHIETTISTFDLLPDRIERVWSACNLTPTDG